MKHLKSMLSTVVLSLALSISVLAGDIQSPGVSAPPPPPATCSSCDEYDSTEIQSTSSDVTLPAEAQSLETSEFAVDLLLALLSFF